MSDALYEGFAKSHNDGRPGNFLVIEGYVFGG